eukprot:m.239747 g.239747  ORF g.239747 m.239747 type:complete len:513 (-) comp22805_c0_seq1:17-1555(-)
MKSGRSSTMSSIDRSNLTLQSEERPLLDPVASKAPEFIGGQGGRIRAFYVLILLSLIYTTNQIDRGIVPQIKTQIEEDLNLSEKQYGYLVGYGFSLMFVIAGVFLGRLVDHFSRKTMLLLGLLLWSGMTALATLTTRFDEMLATRIGLGLGTAVCNPASFSLITDYFPPAYRALANSIYNFGIYTGSGIAAGLGALSWKLTFPLLGLAGGGLAVALFFSVSEPTRGRYTQLSNDGIAPPPVTVVPLRVILRYLVSVDTVLVVSLAAGMRSFAGYTFSGYAPTFFYNTYCSVAPSDHLHTYMALTSSIGGVASSFLGGYITQRWQASTRAASAYVPALGSLFACPFLALFFFSHRIFGVTTLGMALAQVFLFFAFLCAEVWAGPAAAIIQSILPRNISGTGFGVYFFILTLVGGAGPEVVSQFDMDTVQCNNKTLKVVNPLVMSLLICGCYLLGALGFLFSSRFMDRDVETRRHFETNGYLRQISTSRQLGSILAFLVIIGSTAYLSVDAFRG